MKHIRDDDKNNFIEKNNKKGKKMSVEKNGIITLSNSVAECKISLFGGNIVSYRPKSEEQDIFWLGDLNKFDNVQAIRGGIPVCWPRFAEEKLNNNLPRHGFARLSNWSVGSILVDETKMEAELFLIPDAKYGVDVSAKLFIKVTDKLECKLETTNNGDNEFMFSEALHAYFNVFSRDDTIIKGFSGCRYKSSLDGKVYDLEKDLQIKSEFDSAFINHTGKVEIEDKGLNRIITLEKTGSNTTVVWNPDRDYAEMSPEQYKNFICVEPANNGDCFVTLPSKEKHTISMTVSVRKIK